MRRARLALGVLALGLVGSQAGHLIAYEVRFGSAAQQLQSAGPHAYFPAVAKTTLGAAAAAFVAAIFVIGLARVLAGRSRTVRGSAPRHIELLAALFTIQLVAFMAQEVVEAMLAGTAVQSAPHLLLWGTLAQLPVAAVAASALGWLWTRFGSAVDELRAVLAARRAPPEPMTAPIAVWTVPERALLLSLAIGGPLSRRGPPASSRFSS